MAGVMSLPGTAGGERTALPPERPSPWLLVLPLAIILALLPPALTGALAAALAGAALLLARPRWALYALAFTVPYQSLFDVKVYGVSVTVTEVVVVLLLAAWLTQVVAGRAARPRRSPLVVAVTVLVVTLSLSVLVATNLALSAKELLKWVELAATYIAGSSLLETPRQRRTLLVWLVGAGLSEALLGLLQSVLRRGPEHFMIGGVLMRAYGTFEQPNPYGGYLGLTLPVVVALVLFGLPPGQWRRVAGTIVALMAAALLLTLSRGAWSGQAVALLLVLMMGSRAARQALVTFGVLGALLAAGLWPLAPPQITGRLASIVTSAVDLGHLAQETVTPENWSVMERLSQWYAGWQMFINNPILGVGIGNYNAAYDTYRLDQWPIALGHAHNHYLTIAAEAGLLGLAAYAGFLATAFGRILRAYRQARDPFGRALAVGILGSLASFATHNMVDVLFVHGMGVTIGLLLALVDGVPLGVEAPSAPHPRVPPSLRPDGRAVDGPIETRGAEQRASPAGPAVAPVSRWNRGTTSPTSVARADR